VVIFLLAIEFKIFHLLTYLSSRALYCMEYDSSGLWCRIGLKCLGLNLCPTTNFWKKRTRSHLTCLTMVDFPDSPVPRSKTLTIRTVGSSLGWSWMDLDLKLSRCFKRERAVDDLLESMISTTAFRFYKVDK